MHWKGKARHQNHKTLTKCNTEYQCKMFGSRYPQFLLQQMQSILANDFHKTQIPSASYPSKGLLLVVKDKLSQSDVLTYFTNYWTLMTTKFWSKSSDLSILKSLSCSTHSNVVFLIWTDLATLTFSATTIAYIEAACVCISQIWLLLQSLKSKLTERTS